MKTILLIASHEVRLFMRDRAAYVWLFVVPILFTAVMSLAVRAPGGPADARPQVVVDNRDTGFMGRIFLRELGEQGLTLVAPDAAGDARRGITVPADFTERILAREAVKLETFIVEGADTGMSELVTLRLVRVVIAMNARLARHAIDSRGAPPTEASLAALIEAEAPVSLAVSHAGRKPQPVGFSFSLPGNLVAYTFLNILIFGGASVADQRRSGVLRRLAVHPVTRAQLLFGKLIGLELLAAVQMAVLLVVGQFALGVNIAENLGGILVLMLVFAWVAASLGVLIGVLIQAEDKVIGLSLAIALPSAAIGGCWWPLEVAPPFFQQLALAVPAGWAMQGLHQLITFGAGIGAITTPLLVLAAFALVANLAAARFFRV